MADLKRAAKAVSDFLAALDIDIDARGMEKTPTRVAKMYGELFSGVRRSPKELWGETFQTGSGGLVAVRHIPFYSMCEHHLVPFFGETSIVYLPEDGRVAGFSKFTAVVDLLSRRPQLQERLTREIAESVLTDLGARAVLVLMEAQQLCMTMRGELAHGTRTMTTERLGLFATDDNLYREAWALLGKEKA